MNGLQCQSTLLRQRRDLQTNSIETKTKNINKSWNKQRLNQPTTMKKYITENPWIHKTSKNNKSQLENKKQITIRKLKKNKSTKIIQTSWYMNK